MILYIQTKEGREYLFRDFGIADFSKREFRIKMKASGILEMRHFAVGNSGISYECFFLGGGRGDLILAIFSSIFMSLKLDPFSYFTDFVSCFADFDIFRFVLFSVLQIWAYFVSFHFVSVLFRGLQGPYGLFLATAAMFFVRSLRN